jgi:gamma-glutamyltranspeptidase/glutathione hydrolase
MRHLTRLHATRAVLAAACTLMSVTLSQTAEAHPARGEASRSVVRAPQGMVAAAQPLAVQAGVDILKRGGSAVDAAIAVNACLGLMEPTANGLGGDLFAIVWDPKTKQVVGLNASGRAPLALTIEKIKPGPDGTIPLFDPQAWSVPGCADGWFELHGRYGKLPMKDVLAAAIRYAEEGFPLSPVIASDWQRSLTRFADMPGFADVFMPGGRAPNEGEIFRNPALAKTLRALAAGGRDAYYKGAIAKEIVRYSKAHGGFFELRDFTSHRSTWDAPITTSYRGYDVWELPPNGQGLAALQMLNMLEPVDLKSMGRESADFWHVMIEAKKLAFADRARYYADPAFAKVPIEALLSKDYAKTRARLIDMAHAAQADAPGESAALNRSETTFLCTADAQGMMVSLIQSNYTGFGSGYVIPALGFGLQNRGALFSLDPSHPNRLEPGKRPFHTIIPAFLSKDGTPLMAFGLMGGDMQPQGHVQVLVNLLDLGMNLQEAGDVPRFYHTGSSEPTGGVMSAGGELHIEEGLPAAVLDALKARGHVMTPVSIGAYGGYQAIWRDPATGAYIGATEKRKDGCAMGY